MKKILILLALFPFIGFAQSKSIAKKNKVKLPTTKSIISTISTTSSSTSTLDISAGLKEALNKGITEQVAKLTAEDGFYKNEAVKILMPEELQKVDATLNANCCGTFPKGVEILLADKTLILLFCLIPSLFAKAEPIITDPFS